MPPLMMRGLTDGLASLQLGSQGYAGTAIRLAMPFVILYSGLIAAVEQASFVEVLLSRGLITGLLFGLILAFFLKGEIATVEVAGDKRAFLSRMNIAIWRMGYQPATQTENFVTYRPFLDLGGWRIWVQVHDDQVVIFGPKMSVEKVKKALAEA